MDMTDQQAPFRDLKVDDIKKLIDEGYEVSTSARLGMEQGHVPGARHVVLNAIPPTRLRRNFATDDLRMPVGSDRGRL